MAITWNLFSYFMVNLACQKQQWPNSGVPWAWLRRKRRTRGTILTVLWSWDENWERAEQSWPASVLPAPLSQLISCNWEFGTELPHNGLRITRPHIVWFRVDQKQLRIKELPDHRLRRSHVPTFLRRISRANLNSLDSSPFYQNWYVEEDYYSHGPRFKILQFENAL